MDELIEVLTSKKKVKSFIEIDDYDIVKYAHYSGIVDGYNTAIDDVIRILKGRSQTAEAIGLNP